jgi:hypothetical protein
VADPWHPPMVINDRSVTEVKLDGLNANNKNPRRKSVPCWPAGVCQRLQRAESAIEPNPLLDNTSRGSRLARCWRVRRRRPQRAGQLGR